MPLDIPRSDDPWNLRPYDVPWGPSYYQYKPGKLPGHDGDCLMLRSPTPIEQRRTAIACRHCRQRKAKCSGDQPACSRCAYSGRKCVYPEERRPQPANKPRASKTARDILSDSFRRDSSISLASTSTDSSESSSEEVYAKEEDDRDAESYLLYDMRSEGHLQHWPPYCTIDSPRSEYSSPPSTAYSEVDYDVVVGGGGGSQTYFDYHEPGASTSTPSTLSAAIYAPRPVHPSAAPPDLAYPHSEIVPQVPGEPVRYSYQDPPAQSAAGAVAGCAPESAGGPISVAGAPPQTFISITDGAELAAASLVPSDSHSYVGVPDAQSACFSEAGYGYAAQAPFPVPPELQMPYAAAAWYVDDRAGYYVLDNGASAYAACYAEQPGGLLYAHGAAM